MPLTRQQLEENINALETQGAPQKDIQDYLNTLKHDSLSGNYFKPGEKVEPAQKPKKSAFQKVLDVGTSISNFVGGKGVADTFGSELAKVGKTQQEKDIISASQPSIKETIGSGLQLGSNFLPTTKIAGGAAKLLGKTGLKKGTELLGKVGAGAIAGYGLDVGSKLQEGDSVGQSLKPGIGTAIGSTLPVAGAGISVAKKAVPPALSFTSGVPKKAIEQAIKSPDATKIGRTGANVEAIRETASTALKGLRKDLGDEFGKGLQEVTSKTGQTKAGVIYDDKGFLKSGNKIRERLVRSTRDFAREFRISMKKTPEGMQVDFSKSPIVKGGEKANVQEAMNTISTWNDWSAKGMQDLAERVGALRKFESGARTESSAILGKMYNRLTSAGEKGAKGIIGEFYPELADLRTKYASTRKILDNIDDIIQVDKTNPRAVQASISRLSNIFKEDKDTYIKVIKELSDRSGTDILGLLAGTEFQRVLPDFVRGIGGGGAVAIGSAVLNPWLALLAPLFSPRAVGKGLELGVKSKPIRKAISETTKKVAPLVGTKIEQ